MNNVPIVISIKPKWADLIKKGIKTFEVRTWQLPLGRDCYVYESYPIQKITASFKVKAVIMRGNGIHHAPEDYLEFLDRACISAGELSEYLGGRKHVYFHEVYGVNTFKEPFTLEDVGLRHPPQSWCYAKKVIEW